MKSFEPFIRVLFLVLIAVLSMQPGDVLALQPDEIAMVVNSNQPQGKALAQFYARQRRIPDNRILELDLPFTDEISNRQYEEQVVPAVREFLRSAHLETKVKSLVTFYGVPLRIGARINTAQEARELSHLRQELIGMPDALRPPVEAVEAMAKKLDPAFAPVGSSSDLEQLTNRTGAAARAILKQVQTFPDKKRQAQIQAEFYQAATPLLGRAGNIEHVRWDLVSKGTTQPSDVKPLYAMRDDYQAAIHDATPLELLPYDAQARQQLRDLVKQNFGLLQYVKLLRDQVDYLDPEMSTSAFDSELSLVEWTAYPHRAWFPNPLYYLSKSTVHQPTLMITRLDAPTPELVKSIITTSIKVEAQGLSGKVVIDSLGLRSGEEPPGQQGYGVYDQYLRNLQQMLHDETKLDIVFDEKPEVLPANSASDVALYCGWHSARNYVPSCKFSPGAVGYHIASYELVSLRGPNETGWVHGLLDDGMVATLGPVAEPYLAAFPRPDEFFPLLLTGKLSMAEVYWKSMPSASWMIAFIGDPLYTPYKTNPQLSELELPFRLRSALHQQGPATQPVGH